MTRSAPYVGATMSAVLLRAGRRVRIRARGRSMMPAIADGERLLVEPVRAEDLAVGHIVLCRRGTPLVAHRVLEVRRKDDGSTVVAIRGDAPGERVEEVRADDVLGRVVEIQHERGSRVPSRRVPRVRRALRWIWRAAVALRARGRA